ncbi:MAG: hypothetical protein ACI8PZ_005458 [Myxococcota bacterium]|jgi:hypothetical protein
MTGTLENLLVRIRDGAATDGDLARARSLASHDARLPEELRRDVLLTADEAPSDAAGLLSVLGADDLFGATLREAVAFDLSMEFDDELPDGMEIDDDWVWGPLLAEAVRAEAGAVEVADGVLARVERGSTSDWVYGPVLSEAVRRESGQVDVSSLVHAGTGGEISQVAEAVRAEAGDPPWASGTALVALVADAVRAEAGRVDVSAEVLVAVGGKTTLAVGDAVRSAAGGCDVSHAVLAAVGAVVLPVAQAVRSEAGRPELVAGVAAALGHAVLPVAEAVRDAAGQAGWATSGEGSVPLSEAVRAEAGSVDLWDAVAGSIGAVEVAPTMPSVIAPSETLPAPANRASWTWGAALMAAVVLFVFGASQLVGAPTVGPAEAAPMQFASASEVIVDALEWSDSVQVMQTEGDEGALIIWVDEEAT